jgi:hypothetical protein
MGLIYFDMKTLSSNILSKNNTFHLFFPQKFHRTAIPDQTVSLSKQGNLVFAIITILPHHFYTLIAAKRIIKYSSKKE